MEEATSFVDETIKDIKQKHIHLTLLARQYGLENELNLMMFEAMDAGLGSLKLEVKNG